MIRLSIYYQQVVVTGEFQVSSSDLTSPFSFKGHFWEIDTFQKPKQINTDIMFTGPRW